MLSGWVYAVGVASLPLLGVSGYSKTSICLPMDYTTTVDRAYLITLLTINAAAFLVICACYGKVSQIILHSIPRLSNVNISYLVSWSYLTSPLSSSSPRSFQGHSSLPFYHLRVHFLVLKYIVLVAFIEHCSLPPRESFLFSQNSSLTSWAIFLMRRQWGKGQMEFPEQF